MRPSNGVKQMPATQKKQNVVIQEAEIQDFLIRYPGLGRMDVLLAIVRAGPRRTAIDAEIGRLWGKVVLSLPGRVNQAVNA
jgi:hypothetical protein